MLAQGAGIIYNVAGPLGIGDLEAITEHLEAKNKSAGPPFMIGVDANQDYLGDGHRVLASMMKRVDFGVQCHRVRGQRNLQGCANLGPPMVASPCRANRILPISFSLA